MRSHPTPSPRPLTPLLLARATFGYTPEEARRVEALGHDAWLAEQLRPAEVNDSELEAKLKEWPWLARDARYIAENPDLDPEQMRAQFKGIRILRAVASRRQLHERAVEFWADHFSVYVGSLTRIFDDRTRWRAHAFGSFFELLVAVTSSASMVFYLDNHTNTFTKPNENLAREILELHTLGADGPYTERDVREFARALTGWTFQYAYASAQFGSYWFDESMHDDGPKEILGIPFPAGGGDGDVMAVLRHLASMPETADHVTRRMARWFLGESAPESVIARAKTVWSETDGDLREVLRTLLCEDSIAKVAMAGSRKFRRPLEWLTAVYRGSTIELPDVSELHAMSQRLGQSPFEWYSPDGFPDDRASWVGLVEPRWGAATTIFRAPRSEGSPVIAALMKVVAQSPRSAWAKELADHWTGGQLRGPDVREIQTYIDAFPPETPPESVLADACELLVTCPSYQEI
ncbi:MAG: DUF1800 domain-containing protein [Planctomycetota bacterium]